jgi:myosin heavy subunit
MKITSFCRGYFTRIKYMKTLAAATTIQTIVRGHIAKKLVEEMKCFQIFLKWDDSAKKIQAQFRRRICKSMYNTVLTGVVSLQAKIRSIRAMKTVNDLMIARAQAATLIQKKYRSFYASSAFLAHKRAAPIIQSAVRRHICVLKYRSMKKASVLVQAKFRSKQGRESFLLHLNCVHILQRTGRKFLAEVKTKQLAATNIQRIWRGYSANVDFMLLVLATIKIQAFARMRSAFTAYKNTLDGIILTQACFRSKLARKTISSQQCSIIILQKVGRGFLARIHKEQQLAAIAVIQRAVRRMIARSREEVRSCIIIQKAGRGFLARMYRKVQLAAAVIIQRATRKMMARSHNETKASAATEIQRVWRGFSAHVDYMIQVMAAMKIQSRYREVRAKRALLVLSYQRKSTIILQKVGRGFLARMHMKEQLAAIAVIQRAAREMIARAHDDLVRNFAASEIQRIWRGFSAHIDYMLQVMAAIRIQVSVRCFLMKRRLHRTARMSKERLKAVQENDLVEDSAVKEPDETKPQIYQTWERRLELFPRILAESPDMKNMDSPPRVIDVIAYESSKSNREVNNVSAIPKIITTASYVAPPNKIHVRSLSKYEKHTAKAIKVLRKSELFPEVMEAVSTLEKTTSKSIDSCKLLLKARAHDNLLSLLSRCNRSSPHLELVRVILQIFTNISRHQDSSSVLVTRESSALITDVVQMFRDKADIFTLSTSLLESFVRCETFVLSDYSSHEHRKCLRGVLDLTQKRASARSCPQFDKGIACLENVIRIVEGGNRIKTKCPYCDREFP